MQQKAIPIQRREGGKKTDRIESPAVILESRMKKSSGESTW
jgi:hypothetical protein